jgi:L-lactate dehydrogenase (cytochrome)
MDGGIRSGQDVLKAWALGARGTYIGRAFLYGLGAMGEAGVTKALEIIHKELDLTMALLRPHRHQQSGPPRHWRRIASAGPQWPPAGRGGRVFR